jgi:hypothetical protein
VKQKMIVPRRTTERKAFNRLRQPLSSKNLSSLSTRARTKTAIKRADAKNREFPGCRIIHPFSEGSPRQGVSRPAE